eukprot:Skav214464  [mRNA]  locus=scaffold1167:31773:39104:- [translate_table: standard]
MMTTSMLRMLVGAVTFGAAAWANCATAFDLGPHLSLLKLQSSLQLLRHPIFYWCLSEQRGQLQGELMSEVRWLRHIKVCHNWEALREDRPGHMVGLVSGQCLCS